MRQTWSSRFACVLACLVCVAIAPQRAGAKLRVIATTSDVAAVLEAVGGERIDLTTLAKGYMNPHYLEAKPSYVAKLRRADALAYNGLQLEIGWLPLILEGARNRKIVVGAAGHVQMSRGLEILEIPEGAVTREMGDIHPEGNPHYTLDPRNVVRMARTAEEVLSQIDPDGAATYAKNRAAFASDMQTAIARWEERMRPYRGGEVVCYHKQWEYLLHWLGIEPVAYVESKPGIPASPRHLEQLARMMKERRIPVLLASSFDGNIEHLNRLAAGAGTRVLVLPAAVGGEEGLETPLAYFDFIVDTLAQAFQGAGAP